MIDIIVSFVFHEQQNSIKEQVDWLNASLLDLGLRNHTIHTAPLIRHEQIYKDLDLSLRHKIFYKIFNFTRKIKISYSTLIVKKHIKSDSLEITGHLSK